MSALCVALAMEGLTLGGRHDWRLVMGYMEPDILSWLRAEAEEKLQVWKAGASSQGLTTTATKFTVPGKVADECFSKSLNGMDVSRLLPAPRLCAFVRAFTAANQASIINLVAKCQAELEQLRAKDENIGASGRFVLEKSVYE